ncbi:MFS general substrate transporter [Lophiostoma macrostomum CBS 122681]|uniref:MFS general substrate transporter n=1 Tax=Lophiostoma macrostomum CBS 122681 TaxID=1314788 RepID=A0A6A6SXV7_9PLEO|nr:MFS general substrate transporter [Lophiostoma macrostomum CBS 122681]
MALQADEALSKQYEASSPDDVSIRGKLESSKDEQQTKDHFMSGPKLHVLILGVAIAVFLMALDMSIISTAIPFITVKFHSTEDIGWYISGYLVTLCSLQPLSGKLYANFSLKWTFLSFVLIFLLGSVFSAAATSSPMLIIGRAIAGAGAAGLMSGSLSIVAVVVPMRVRPLYTGILSSLFGLSTVIGPLLGGAFTQHVSWRWVFYINLPIGGVTIGVLILFFNPPVRAVDQLPTTERIKRLDLLGLGWRDVLLVFIAGLLLIIFGIWQWHVGEHAMLPLDIMLQRSVLWAGVAAFFAQGALVQMGLWLPEWFQVVKGRSPVGAGVGILPSVLAQVLASIVSGALITKTGYVNPWLLAGTVLMSIGTGLYTTFDVDTGSSHWIGYEVIFGLGTGMFLLAPLVSVQAVLDAEKTPVGISTVSFFQMFGGALFGGVSQAIFNEQLVKALIKNAPGVDVEKLLAAGTTGIKGVVTPEQLPAVLHSYNTAILKPFYLAAAICAAAFFAGLGVEWVSVKGKNLMATDAA